MMWRNSLLVWSMVFLVVILFLTACAPTADVAEEGAAVSGACDVAIPSVSGCTPLSAPLAVTCTGGDISSLELQDGISGYLDNSSDSWCDPWLGLTTVDVGDLVNDYGCFTLRATPPPPSPCTPYNVLAALGVSPSEIGFPAHPRPRLTFDLSEPYYQPEEGLETINSFAIYQLKSEIPPSPQVAWRHVGEATKGHVGSTIVASGRIDHFSIFALVALPDPVTVQPPGNLEMVVASAFSQGENGAITVAFEIRTAGDPGLQGAIGETRIFRLTGVDPTFSDDLPPECIGLDSIADSLTCLLPVETEVAVVIEGSNFLRIENRNRGYEVTTYATVEIH